MKINSKIECLSKNFKSDLFLRIYLYFNQMNPFNIPQQLYKNFKFDFIINKTDK